MNPDSPSRNDFPNFAAALFSKRIATVAVALFLLLPVLAQEATPPASNAFDPATESRVLEISDQLRCPVCQGLSVKESNTVIAENMKSEIRDRLAQGKSEAEILEFFQLRYGEWILRTPKADGINLLVWIGPFVAIAVAFALTAWKFHGWRQRGESSEATASLTDEEEEKFNRLFKRES